MAVSQIKLYELVRSKFGDKDSETFVHLIEEKMDEKIDQRTHDLATKQDIAKLREELLGKHHSTEGSMHTMRSELLRTIYATSLGQLIAIIASVISLIIVLKK